MINEWFKSESVTKNVQFSYKNCLFEGQFDLDGQGQG